MPETIAIDTEHGQARVQLLPKGDPDDTAVLRNFVTAVLAVEPDATGPAVLLYAWATDSVTLRIAVLCEAGEEYDQLRGVSITGRAEVIDSEPRLSELMTLLVQRNHPELHGQGLAEQVERMVRKRVVVAVLLRRRLHPHPSRSVAALKSARQELNVAKVR